MVPCRPIRRTGRTPASSSMRMSAFSATTLRASPISASKMLGSSLLVSAKYKLPWPSLAIPAIRSSLYPAPSPTALTETFSFTKARPRRIRSFGEEGPTLAKPSESNMRRLKYLPSRFFLISEAPRFTPAKSAVLPPARSLRTESTNSSMFSPCCEGTITFAAES